MTQGDGCFFSVHLLLQEAPHAEEFWDDSTVWGVRCTKTLAPSPKSPGDFTSAAQLASTPFHKLPVDSVHALEDKGCVTLLVQGIGLFYVLQKQKGHYGQIKLFDAKSN